MKPQQVFMQGLPLPLPKFTNLCDHRDLGLLIGRAKASSQLFSILSALFSVISKYSMIKETLQIIILYDKPETEFMNKMSCQSIYVMQF